MNKIFRLEDDEFTCRFWQLDPQTLPNEHLTPVDFQQLDASREVEDRLFLIAAAVVHVGERQHRPVVRRKLTRKTRNINNRSCRAVWCLRWAQHQDPSGGGITTEKKMGNQLQKQVNEAVAAAMAALSWPGVSTSRWSYHVTDEVLDVATAGGCGEYFHVLAGQRFFAADLEKIETALLGQTFDAASVMGALRATRTDEHLAMISLSADEEGSLFVTVVAPEGHHLKVAADRFTALVEHNEQPRKLFAFPARGSRESIPCAFNSNNTGDVIGQLQVESMKLDVACCQTVGIHSNMLDRSCFFLDPEYLLCLWLVLNRLKQDRARFSQLKSFAEATVTFNPFVARASL